jgi:tetratricopeptide (TPR) repeat protein
MNRAYLVLVLGLVLAACAPTVTGDPLGEADLSRVLPGSGTYTPPRGVYEALPTVSEERLTHPDPRVREEAFALLRRQKTVGDSFGPEFHYLYGRYYEASGDYKSAASYYNVGLKALYPFAFDRQGRDVWEYGYRRAEAYLRFAPEKAARDARILAEKGAPARPGELPQAARAYALLVRAEEALGNPEGVLEVVGAFYRSLQGVNWGGRVADLFWRTTLAKARALERLGRLAEAREEYARIASTQDLFLPDEVRREAREALVRLGAPKTQEAPASPPPQASPSPPPPPASPVPPAASSPEKDAVETVKGFFEAVRALDFAGINRYLSQPFYDALKERELSGKVTSEMREKARAIRYEVARVTLPSPTNPLFKAEVIHDLGGERKLLTLYLIPLQDRGLVLLSGPLPLAVSVLLGSVDTEAVGRFLKEVHALLGLPL